MTERTDAEKMADDVIADAFASPEIRDAALRWRAIAVAHNAWCSTLKGGAQRGAVTTRMPDFEELLIALIEVDDAICRALASYQKSQESESRMTVVRRFVEAARLRLDQMEAPFNAPNDD